MWRLGRWLPESAPVSAIDDGEVRRRELSLGLSQGSPFLLEPTGWPDVDVLAFFSSATFGLLSEQTQLSYAKDLRLFLSFLTSQGRGWREASWSEVLDYEHWRRRDAANPRRVSGTKIMRELAAGKKFYEWQLRRRRVSVNPFGGGHVWLGVAGQGRALSTGEVVDSIGFSAVARCGVGRPMSGRVGGFLVEGPELLEECRVRESVVVQRSSTERGRVPAHD